MNKKLLIDPHKDELRERVEKIEEALFKVGRGILTLDKKLLMHTENMEGLLKLVEAHGKEIDRISKYVCKECGFAYDTPNHELGCENDNEDNNRVDRAD